MRAVHHEKELARAFAEASLEAEKAFGDPRLYLEKLIEGGRHVEFQVLCDAFGNGIHLGERECSVQRHHQKLIEESPSPVVDAATRSVMGGRVARAAAGFGYTNAGTVEFLRAPDGSLFFLEMNARLQVEHPVTEMVTGIDLVVEQIRIAALNPLSLGQADVRCDGHAMEFRVNAEDPDGGFRPDPGTITGFSPPSSAHRGISVRWDSAIETGYRIPPNYDSMVGKLIVHGAGREAVLDGAREVLGSLRIEGVRTTIPLHLRILADPGFRRGEYDLRLLSQDGRVRP